MKTEYATISSKGQVVIPASIRQELRLDVGTKLIAHVENGAIIFEPLRESFIDELHGMFEGQPSLTDELLIERRKEDRKEEK